MRKLAALLAVLTLLSPGALADDSIAVTAVKVASFHMLPQKTTFGPLEWRGGIELPLKPSPPDTPMKLRKHLVVPGVVPAEVAEIATFLRATQRQLDHAWSFAGEDDEVDFVLSDLADFGGRCARVRALDEGRHFAVLANPGDDVYGAELVLHRPLSAKALVGLLNHVGNVKRPQPRRLVDIGVTERIIEPLVRRVEERPDPNSTRACFIDIQRVRPCTDLESLVQRGAVLLERPGLQSLLIDPVTDTFHSKARMVDLEPYFLEPVVGRERRRVGGAQLAELRKQHPPRPLARALA